MKDISHQKLVKIFALIPLVFGFLGAWTYTYHYGTYVETTVNLITKYPLPEGNFVIESSGPIPEGYEVKIEKNELLIIGPPLEGTELHMAWNPSYLFARQVHIVTDDLLLPLVSQKFFMQELEKLVIFGSLALIPLELLFNWKFKKSSRTTIITVYKIYFLKLNIFKLHSIKVS